MMMDLIVDFPSGENIINSMRNQEEKKSASFVDEITVYFVQDLTEYKSDLWFSSRDMTLFKAQVARAASSMIAITTSIEDVDNCIDLLRESNVMGLENYLTESVRQGIANRQRAYRRAIMLEQENQRRSGTFWDPRGMGAASRAQTEKSMKRALLIAQIHATS